MDRDGFAERGGTAALSGLGQDTDVTFSTLGLRAATDFALGALRATARGTLGWRHAFGDVTPTAALAFAGGAAFGVAGTPIARNTLLLEAGLDVNLTDTVTLGLSYTGQIAQDAVDQSIRGTITARF